MFEKVKTARDLRLAGIALLIEHCGLAWWESVIDVLEENGETSENVDELVDDAEEAQKRFGDLFD